MKHLVLLSGGHSSALVAIWVVDKFGAENTILINHNIKTGMEDDDIKRFKKEIAEYLGLTITYANINGIVDPNRLPDQFDVCMEAGALTDKSLNALCTHRLKTEPFFDYLSLNFYPEDTLFEQKKDCIIYYGFDADEEDRVMRRSGILGAMRYKTDYPIYKKQLTITNTNQIGIIPPATYSVFKHANCIGCLKAGLLHWYVTFCLRPDVYDKGSIMEQEIDFTIHTVTRDKVTQPISLEELRPIYKQMQIDGVPATEHQSDKKFGLLLRRYQIEACNINKPCECTA